MPTQAQLEELNDQNQQAAPTETTSLLDHAVDGKRCRTTPTLVEGTPSIIASFVSIDERILSSAQAGERLPYNDYTTIDWLRDLVKDSYRYRSLHAKPGLRYRILSGLDSISGWVAAALIGLLTACVAFTVDVAVETVGDWKLGYCQRNPFANRKSCCPDHSPTHFHLIGEDCKEWQRWSSSWYGAYGYYCGWALLFGVVSASLTMLTKSNMPTTAPGQGDTEQKADGVREFKAPAGKTLYLAAGSGIPEIKSILSGFVIPQILDFKVLIIKAVGAVFAVAANLNLGKEGPFVHISTCVANLVGKRLSKYRYNGGKMRELLSAGCAAGLSVAFGAPIGGVLFSYEEISTYFTSSVLWRAFFCSLWAAAILKELNPTGTGKLVLFETNYGTTYQPVHYLGFLLLGVVGGIWGGIFCKCNYIWSKRFRKIGIIRDYPVFEVALVTLVSTLLQYPNPITRELGDRVIKILLQDCRGEADSSWICVQESQASRSRYIGWLVYGTLVKLVLTIITFGCKVPSGIIIPALDAGAFFGRLLGQWIPDISPGIFAMVGAAGFLAGVSRMTISLCVIMFELTGEVEYIIPHMIAILVAKWVADALEPAGVYDLAQTVLGHPFLDQVHARALARQEEILVEELIPPKKTLDDITVHVPASNTVPRMVLEEKLDQLKERGLMDAGLVLVQNGIAQGYFAEAELEFALTKFSGSEGPDDEIKLLVSPRITTTSNKSVSSLNPMTAIQESTPCNNDALDLSMLVDHTPLTVCATAPIEYAIEMFASLGLRYLIVVEQGTGRFMGVVIKKRLLAWLDQAKQRGKR